MTRPRLERVDAMRAAEDDPAPGPGTILGGPPHKIIPQQQGAAYICATCLLALVPTGPPRWFRHAGEA